MKEPCKGATRLAFIPDTHFPFADDAALLDMLDVFRWFKPDIIVHLGDLLDCYLISKHPKTRSPGTLQEEIDQGVAFLAHLRAAFPAAHLHLHEGNHEERLGRLLTSDAPGLSSLRGLAWPELLKLDRMGIGWTPYKTPWMPWGPRGRFEVWHGHKTSTSHPAAVCVKMLKDADVASGVSGHTHRLNLVTHTSGAFTRTWLECGYMACPAVGEEYAVRPNWQQGYGLGWRLPSGEVVLQGVRVEDGRSILPGWF